MRPFTRRQLEQPSLMRGTFYPVERRREACYAKPVLASFMGGKEVEEGISILGSHGIPNYAFPERAMEALHAMVRYLSMVSTVRARMPDAEILGVNIQQMVPQGKEVILGMSRDPQFGPMLMFGLGGIYVEVLNPAGQDAIALDARITLAPERARTED